MDQLCFALLILEICLDSLMSYIGFQIFQSGEDSSLTNVFWPDGSSFSITYHGQLLLLSTIMVSLIGLKCGGSGCFVLLHAMFISLL